MDREALVKSFILIPVKQFPKRQIKIKTVFQNTGLDYYFNNLNI